jgi:hypothetical protein
MLVHYLELWQRLNEIWCWPTSKFASRTNQKNSDGSCQT